MKIQVLKTEIKAKDKVTGKETTFDSYKMNDNGKKVDLRFKKDSNNLSVIPYGVSFIEVKTLEACKNSFYPKYYASFDKVAEYKESPDMHADAETGEVKD